jgi:rod shape-determining protein MreD
VAFDWAKAALLVFLAAILQVSVFSSVTILHGTPDLLLVTIICVALLRGPVVGAAVGFWGGLLIDTANLGTLGVTSLLLTLAGYWTGRYGETTGRDRAHAPLLSVAVITFLYEVAALVLRYMLGQNAPGAAVFEGLVPTMLLNLLLTLPVYALTRRLLRPREWAAREVRLLG